MSWIVAAVAATTLPLAHASSELAQKKACMACHAVDAKRVGPSYKDIAKKYDGQADALTQVALNIRRGGMGRWGQIPMPAQPALSEDDAKALAAWILDGAP